MILIGDALVLVVVAEDGVPVLKTGRRRVGFSVALDELIALLQAGLAAG